MPLNLYMPLNGDVNAQPGAYPIQSIQAGEVDVTINTYPYNLPVPSTAINLSGATCALVVQDINQNLESLPLLVSSDGTFAYRNTLATDFPDGGEYELQLIATFLSGAILKSPIQSLSVQWSLE